MFFEPDLRNVNDAGVDLVMKHFFQSLGHKQEALPDADDEIICDEAELDRFAR